MTPKKTGAKAPSSIDSHLCKKRKWGTAVHGTPDPIEIEGSGEEVGFAAGADQDRGGHVGQKLADAAIQIACGLVFG
jgi:hypothetical protein